MKGINDLEKDLYHRTIYGAYLTARLERAKDFPSLEDVMAPLENNESRHEQSPEEMYEIIQNFDAALKRRRGGG